ncbi:MAG: alanine--tRNA ligase [Alphaproteobacteria bacterium]|nr:alanine--tRNA ligase [Alphaproteobacteria bacterium]
MNAAELRKKFLDFFASKDHAVIAGASLIPENDPSVLFTTAGMHPLVPYLLGEKHPLGQRLANCQKCVRTGDIDEVGDATHLTFFEMLGNWSLNDYFKETAIRNSFEFLTSARGLGLPPDRLAFSVFAGDETAPFDHEAHGLWIGLGVPEARIARLPKKDNWWGPAGQTGPCGPDTEMFYWNGPLPAPAAFDPADKNWVEIWNDVFMQYFKDKDGAYSVLAQKNVDTGLGLERALCVMTGAASVYDTELFRPIIRKIEELTGVPYAAKNFKAYRIVADHLRAATFILGDDRGVAPSNMDQGYVLRRLIRRAYRYLMQMNAPAKSMAAVAEVIVAHYQDAYPELGRNRDFVTAQLNREEELFGRTLDAGMKIATKYLENARGALAPEDAFRLYDTYGFPLEFTQELAAEKNIAVDADGFHRLYAEHQAKSRAGAEQKFKGGLADNSEATTRLHTAAHLMLRALRQVLGESVFQRGSNITAERLRFDFSFDRKMTPEEIAETERLVNEAIAAKIPITCSETSVAEAKESGAIGVFDSKYGAVVKVYSMGPYSKEICGGPHVGNTSELGTFKIVKEEASSAGVRRIKAVLT